MTISYQFDSPDADVILLTADNDSLTEFHVHKCILAAASPFFSDMFSLPQDDKGDLYTSDSNGTINKSKIPIIPVSDSPRDLGTVLRCIYPFPPPGTSDVGTLEEISAALMVAFKYDVEIAISTLRSLLVSPHHLQTHPTRVYAIACRFDLDDEADLAAKHTLRISVLDEPPCRELDYIPALAYHALLAMHRRRSQAALGLLTSVSVSALQCTHCNSSSYTVHCVPRWWEEWVRAAKQEMSLRPTTEIVFGMEFLFRAAKAAGCARCPESLLNSWQALEDLKRSIDALPTSTLPWQRFA